MRVPQDACILVDYERGLSIPNLPWPRLRQGLHQRNDHPWDILQVRSCRIACIVPFPPPQMFAEA